VDAPLRPRRKGIYILPNAITLAALFGGFYAIVMAMNGRFERPASASSAPWCSTAWTAAWRA
jgi:phosphatidylserine synthase